MPVGPRRRHAEIRFEEEQAEFGFECYRFHDFAAAATKRWRMRDEEGNIGAEFGREFYQQVVRKTGIEKFVEAQERAGSVTAAAAQTRSMRNLFFEGQRDPVGDLCSFPKKLRR